MRFHDIYTGFQYIILPNGLSLYVQERTDVSWFYAGIVIHAGAREDPRGRQGLAHLVEHVSGENIDGMTFSQLEKRFKTLGGHGWFGRVSYLSSKYRFHFPADEEAIQEAFLLFGQMLLTAKLTQKISEEQEVIVREYNRRYSHKEDRAWKLQGRPFLFAQHPCLGSFESAIGIPDEFLQATQQEIQTFYDRYYVPRNMSMVCIGQMSLQKLLLLLGKSPFAMQKQGQRNPLPEPFCPRSPLQKHEQVVALSEFSTLGASTATLTVEWVLPLRFTKYCVRIFAELLEAQLTEELRYNQALTYEVSVDYEHYQDCRTLHVELEIPPDALSLTQEILWQHLRFINQAEESFQETKQEILDCIYRMDYSGEDLLQATIADLEGYHRLIPFTEEIRQIQETTFQQVVELAAYLTPERQFTFILLP